MRSKDLLSIFKCVTEGNVPWNRYVIALAWLLVTAGYAIERNMHGVLHGAAAAFLFSAIALLIKLATPHTRCNARRQKHSESRHRRRS